MYHPVSRAVPQDEVGGHPGGEFQILLTRGKRAIHPAAHYIDVRFVYGDPQVDIIFEGFNHPPGVAGEKRGGFLVLPCAFFGQPQRVGEMVQGDHGSHAVTVHPAQHLRVFCQCFIIPAVRFRLDAAPFYREAVGVLSTVARPFQVFQPAAAPPITGQPRALTVGNPAGGSFPLRPVVVVISALHLVGGGGTPPEKAARKLKNGFGHDLLLCSLLVQLIIAETKTPAQPGLKCVG